MSRFVRVLMSVALALSIGLLDRAHGADDEKLAQCLNALADSPRRAEIYSAFHERLGEKLLSYLAMLESSIVQAQLEYRVHKTDTADLKAFENSRLPELAKVARELIDVYSMLDSHTIEASLLDYARAEVQLLSSKLHDLGVTALDATSERLLTSVDSAILEIIPGDQTPNPQIFSEKLFTMYHKYALKNNWTTEIIEQESGDRGGFKSVTLRISGKGAYRHLLMEAGVHKRIGRDYLGKDARTHTSEINVMVYPAVEKSEFTFNERDCEIETLRGTGPGGQNVNKVESVVRITHRPTGIVVVARSERSQIRNKAIAFETLRAKLYAKFKFDQRAKETSDRREMLAATTRVRLYQDVEATAYGANSISANLARVLDGDLNQFIADAEERLLERELDYAIRKLRRP